MIIEKHYVTVDNNDIDLKKKIDWSTESKNYRPDFDKYNREHPEELKLRKDKYKNK